MNESGGSWSRAFSILAGVVFLFFSTVFILIDFLCFSVLRFRFGYSISLVLALARKVMIHDQFIFSPQLPL